MSASSTMPQDSRSTGVPEPSGTKRRRLLCCCAYKSANGLSESQTPTANDRVRRSTKTTEGQWRDTSASTRGSSRLPEAEFYQQTITAKPHVCSAKVFSSTRSCRSLDISVQQRKCTIDLQERPGRQHPPCHTDVCVCIERGVHVHGVQEGVQEPILCCG